MKLTDLSPFWVEKEGVKAALVFKCPHCPDSNWWLSCGFIPMKISEQMDLFLDSLDDRDQIAVPFNQAGNWKIQGEPDLETLTITPSIDASASGHWHGFITNGEIR
jgi:Family of unknown function (DUF6527)